MAGDASAARAAGNAGLAFATVFGVVVDGLCHLALAQAALAEGDVGEAVRASAAGWEASGVLPGYAVHQRPIIAQAALANRDLTAARRWADDAVATATGWAVSMSALTTRARVAIAQGEPAQAECDAHDALACLPDGFGPLCFLPDTLECLAAVAADAGSTREAARLWGSAAAVRQRMGAMRFKVWDADYEATVAALRDIMGENGFHAAWAEGAALSSEEAIAAASANARPAAGRRSPRPSRTWCDWSAKGWPIMTSRQGFSCHHARSSRISRTSTPSWA